MSQCYLQYANIIFKHTFVGFSFAVTVLPNVVSWVFLHTRSVAGMSTLQVLRLLDTAEHTQCVDKV